MDKRKIIEDKEISLQQSMQSKRVNLEIANVIETLEDLNVVIKSNANNKFRTVAEENKAFTIFSTQYSLEEKPRAVWVLGLGFSFILIRRQILPKFSILIVACLLTFYTSARNYMYCKSQPEFKSFVSSNNNLKSIIDMKIKSIPFIDRLKISIGLEFKGISKNFFVFNNTALI